VSALILAFLAGLFVAWLYGKAGRLIIGSDKWRERAIRNMRDEEVEKLHASLIQEHARRWPV